MSFADGKEIPQLVPGSLLGIRAFQISKNGHPSAITRGTEYIDGKLTADCDIQHADINVDDVQRQLPPECSTCVFDIHRAYLVREFTAEVTGKPKAEFNCEVTIHHSTCSRKGDQDLTFVIEVGPAHDLQAPGKGCACGIYGFYTWDAYQKQGGNYGVNNEPLIGIIECHGRTVMGEFGFRATSARIVALAPGKAYAPQANFDKSKYAWFDDVKSMLKEYPTSDVTELLKED